MENAGDVVLKVGSFAAVGLRYRFYVLRPPPSGFELGSAYGASAIFTSSIFPFSNLRTSSGELRCLTSILNEGIDPPLPFRIIRLVVYYVTRFFSLVFYRFA